MSRYDVNKKRLSDAEDYINYGIKEGYFDEDQFIGMSEDELIEFAEKAMEEAEWYYDSLRDN